MMIMMVLMIVMLMMMVMMTMTTMVAVDADDDAHAGDDVGACDDDAGDVCFCFVFCFALSGFETGPPPKVHSLYVRT